jgi:hypothetical protein
VLEAPPEPIRTPGDEGVEPRAPGVRDEAVQSRLGVLGPGYGLAEVPAGRPAAGLDVSPELLDLVLRLLSSIDADTVRGIG